MADAQVFGKYLLLRKLAAGGMGEVFLAKQQGLEGFEKFLVIKRILSHHTDNPDYIDMFFAEARLAARMSHSNIVQIYDMGEVDGGYFIAMEYVNGKSMKDIIDAARAKGVKLEPAHIAEMVIKLASGLGYAHNLSDMSGNSLNIIHRDINPHNALVSYGGEVKVIDFGIAKSDTNEHKTETGTIKGKFVYMSPEQSAAEKIDKRSDIFSVGIVLYEFLAGENPFQKPNIVLSLDAIQRSNPPPPSTIDPAFAVFDEIAAKALAKKADDRYQDCAELVSDLQRAPIPRASKSLQQLMQELFRESIEKERMFMQDVAKGNIAIAPVAARPKTHPPGMQRQEVIPMTEPEALPPVRGRTGFDQTPPPTQRPVTGAFNQNDTNIRASAAARRRRTRNITFGIVGLIVAVCAATATMMLMPAPKEQEVQINFNEPVAKPTAPVPNTVVGSTAGVAAPTAALGAAPPATTAQPVAIDPAKDAAKDAAKETPKDPPKEARDDKKDRDKGRGRDRNDKIRDDVKHKEDSVAATPEPAKVVVVTAPPESKPEAKPEPKPEPKKPDPPPAEPAVELGSFTIVATPAAAIFRDGARVTSGGGATRVELKKSSGTIKIGDPTSLFQVTMSYKFNGKNVDVTIDSQPWAVVKKDGISMGRTPRPNVSVMDGTKRFEFVSPLVQGGQQTMTVAVRYQNN